MSKMAPKWPRGPFRARQGTTLINVSHNVQTEAFVASFLCYIACIKAVIGIVGLLETSGALLGGILVASEPLLPFGAYLGLSW